MDHSCNFCCVFVMLSCASVYCCLVIIWWERADVFALVCDVLFNTFLQFPPTFNVLSAKIWSSFCGDVSVKAK